MAKLPRGPAQPATESTDHWRTLLGPEQRKKIHYLRYEVGLSIPIIAQRFSVHYTTILSVLKDSLDARSVPRKPDARSKRGADSRGRLPA